MNQPAWTEEKAGIRRRVLSLRETLPQDARRAWDEAIRRAVLASPAYRAARSVFLYVSTAGEPDTRGILDAALKDGKRVYVPKCLGKTMLAVPFPGWEGMAPGLMGIPEPAMWDGDAPEDAIDLTLTPCVTASRDGGRLGHGGGYYDRFFAGRQTLRACLCYEALLTDAIPVAPWDARMDALVTERGWQACELNRGEEEKP